MGLWRCGRREWWRHGGSEMGLHVGGVGSAIGEGFETELANVGLHYRNEIKAFFSWFLVEWKVQKGLGT